MKIPRRIKVAGHWIKIVQAKKCTFKILPTKIQLGESDNLDNTITLRLKFAGDNISESNIAETFLHEIIHVIDHKFNLGLKEDSVYKLSQGLFAVIRDNKINFLSEE
jgi:hypothetical protein